MGFYNFDLFSTYTYVYGRELASTLPSCAAIREVLRRPKKCVGTVIAISWPHAMLKTCEVITVCIIISHMSFTGASNMTARI